MEPPPPKRSILARILRFPLTRLVLALIFVIAGTIVSAKLVEVVAALFELAPDDTPYLVLQTVFVVLAVHLAYVAYVRVVERRSVDELSIAGAASGLGAGVLIGTGFFVTVLAAVWILGCYHVVDVNPWTVAIPMLLVAITTGYVEEVIARGIVFRIIEDGLGTWFALAISAVLFGALHGGNPGATWMSTISIVSTAGILLAAAYALTRKLWIAIGIHGAWNFVQGGIFGVAVSGHEVEGILVAELEGPELIAGGAFGVEASIFTIAFGVPLGVGLLVLAHKRGRFVRPFWRK